MPPPTLGHFALLEKLAEQLGRLLPGHQISRGSVGVGIRRNPLRYRIPDICVYAPGAIAEAIRKEPSDPFMWTAPVFIVECLSPSNRRGNLAELLADYESIGVPEVWFFYPEKRVFQKYTLESGKLHLKEDAAPEFISLQELWAAFHGTSD